jgi:alkaline phosphatase D
MIGGDQHLSTIVHHGIDDWNDAGWSFAVPSVANFYPRAWRPKVPGRNRREGMPDYTGEYLDGLGNHVTMWAATNPGESMGRKPAALHDKMPGYGIIRFDKKRRTITMECWPRFAVPGKDRPYPGWPKTIHQLDNYGRKAVAYLPTLDVKGLTNPVVQIVDEATGDLVYTLRIKGNTFRPKVFREGSYTVKISEPDEGKAKTIEHVQSLPETQRKSIQVTWGVP